MIRQLIRDFRQLHYALKRYYRRRGRRPHSPEQEADRILSELNWTENYLNGRRRRR